MTSISAGQLVILIFFCFILFGDMTLLKKKLQIFLKSLTTSITKKKK
uniref:Sec-independent protein translocase component tatA/E n=1 Tax=Trieres regia TaxID=1335017 RepID=A0A7T5BN24_9STRA|nr:Sec-independent protein translocase component tatA/E [Odontella regia]QQD79293.1 Sec-independent protein translocase component tatA/E [Odontella regia]